MRSLEDFKNVKSLDGDVTRRLDKNFRLLDKETLPYIVTQNYTFTENDQINSLQVDATADNIIITLPSPTGNRRRRIIKTDTGTNTVTVTSSPYLMGDNTTYILRDPYWFIEVEPTGSGWLVINYGQIYIGSSGGIFLGKGSLATNASSGFVYIPTCAGVPIGTPGFPAIRPGFAPFVVDSTNNKLWIYISGVWRAMSGAYGSVVIKTTTYTVTTGDEVVVGNHATVAFTVTLIAASTNVNKEFIFKNKGAANMTIDATGLGQFFSTAAVNTIVLVTGDAIKVVSDGSTWLVI